MKDRTSSSRNHIGLPNVPWLDKFQVKSSPCKGQVFATINHARAQLKLRKPITTYFREYGNQGLDLISNTSIKGRKHWRGNLCNMFAYIHID